MYLILSQEQIPSISTELVAHVNGLENPAIILLFPQAAQPLTEMFLEIKYAEHCRNQNNLYDGFSIEKCFGLCS